MSGYTDLYRLYQACQELRSLMGAVAVERRVQRREHLEQRANYQWRTVVVMLEQLAIDEPPAPEKKRP